MRSIWDECGNREMRRRVLDVAHRTWLLSPKFLYSKMEFQGLSRGWGESETLFEGVGILRSNRSLVLRRKEEKGRKTHWPLSGGPLIMDTHKP